MLDEFKKEIEGQGGLSFDKEADFAKSPAAGASLGDILSSALSNALKGIIPPGSTVTTSVKKLSDEEVSALFSPEDQKNVLPAPVASSDKEIVEEVIKKASEFVESADSVTSIHNMVNVLHGDDGIPVFHVGIFPDDVEDEDESPAPLEVHVVDAVDALRKMGCDVKLAAFRKLKPDDPDCLISVLDVILEYKGLRIIISYNLDPLQPCDGTCGGEDHCH